ncbi:MAG: SDR family NAD(P)-dependent oxidoreductase [Trueperaceae bacterium]
MADIRFDNQVVLITGAGRGLGAAYAKLFAERGAKVIVHDAGVDRSGNGTDTGPANDVVAAIHKAGGQAVAEFQDLSSREACEGLVEKTLEQFGRLDVFVHSAGIVTYKGIEDTTVEEWETMKKVNIEAPFWLSRAIWPIMKRQRYGRIVFTVSSYGLKVYEGSDVTAYGVGKAAQFGLMNMLAGEGIPHNIFVNAIEPIAATRIFRRQVAPNELTPESIAPGVVFLGSSECKWTGKVFRAADGKFAVGEFSRTPEVDLGHHATPENIMRAFPNVNEGSL